MLNCSLLPKCLSPISAIVIQIIVVLVWAIPLLIIGAIFWKQCPKEPGIPRFLLVEGVTTFAVILVTFASMLVIKRISEHRLDKIRGPLSFAIVILRFVYLMFTVSWCAVGALETYNAIDRIQFDRPDLPLSYCHPIPFYCAAVTIGVKLVALFGWCSYLHVLVIRNRGH
jgi:hypothetical protein